jgi:hypothetical protein
MNGIHKYNMAVLTNHYSQALEAAARGHGAAWSKKDMKDIETDIEASEAALRNERKRHATRTRRKFPHTQNNKDSKGDPTSAGKKRRRDEEPPRQEDPRFGTRRQVRVEALEPPHTLDTVAVAARLPTTAEQQAVT